MSRSVSHLIGQTPPMLLIAWSLMLKKLETMTVFFWNCLILLCNLVCPYIWQETSCKQCCEILWQPATPIVLWNWCSLTLSRWNVQRLLTLLLQRKMGIARSCVQHLVNLWYNFGLCNQLKLCFCIMISFLGCRLCWCQNRLQCWASKWHCGSATAWWMGGLAWGR